MLSLLIALVVFGAVLYVVQLLPIDALVKRIIYVIATVAMFLYMLEALGLWHGLPALR